MTRPYRSLALLQIALLIASCNTPDHGHDHGTPAPAPEDSAAPHAHADGIELSAQQVAALDMRTAPVVQRAMSGNLTLTGRVLSSPLSKARLTSPIGAKVMDVLVDEGAYVRKGQPLIALTDIAFFRMQEEYLSARAEHQLAAAELQRQRELVAGNATAGKLLQQAEAAASRSEARFRSLAQQLRLLGVDPETLDPGSLQQRFVLRSPVDGRVNGIGIHLDERVEPADVLLEVIDLHHFHVHLNAYERDLTALREGVAFDFKVVNMPGRVFRGEVFSIGRTFDSDGRTIPVHAHVEEGSELLVEGMAVSASIPTSGAERMAVLDAAVMREGDAAFVYADDGETSDGGRRYREIPVVPGPSNAGFTAITPLTALRPDEAIVVAGAFHLRSMRNMPDGHEH